MRKILFVVFIMLFKAGGAQVNFNNVYDYFNQAEFAKGISLIDTDKFLVLSSSSNYLGLYTGLIAFKINYEGSLITSTYVADTNLNYFQELSGSLHHYDSFIFYSGGAYHNQVTADADVILIFFDAGSDSFSIIDYPSVSYEGCIGSNLTKDKGIVLIGQTAPSFTSNNPDWIIYRIDSNKNLLWTKTYGGGIYDLGISIFENPDKSLIASGIKNLTAQNETTWILKLDSAGNILKQKEFNMAPYKCTEGRFTHLNENYLMVGCLDTVYDINDDPNPAYVAKLDTDFNVVWRTDFHGVETRAVWEVKQLPDSTIVFVGDKYTLSGVPLGWIVKLDKYGNVLWEHTYYKTLTIDNYFADFQQTAEKGFIVTGSAWGTTQDVWLVKLDSLGCLDPNDCTFNTGTTEVGNEVTSFSIYPNPASSEATLSYNLPLSVKNAVVQVCDISGKLINEMTIDAQMHEVFLNISGWSNGIYLCTLLIDSHRMKSIKILVNH